MKKSFVISRNFFIVNKKSLSYRNFVRTCKNFLGGAVKSFYGHT